MLLSSATALWHKYIHHSSSCQHGRFIPFFLIPFLPPFLPTTLYWALFFPLFLACSKGIKMGLINSKRTSVCIAKVDVIKDLLILPPSLSLSSLPWTKPPPISITFRPRSSYIGLQVLGSLSNSHRLDPCFLCS